MPSLSEDIWINEQASAHSIAEIEDCAIAVDATYYLQYFLDTPPYHEPLLPALAGLTGLQKHIETDLDQWQANNILPFFVFDGQSIVGQDEVFVSKGRRCNEKTDHAWDLYFNSRAEDAVVAFGANGGAFRTQNLYPLLQGILKQRRLHFLVAPFNAAAQIAYLDMIDSDQCAGIMGSQELLLYPIRDCIIKNIDWENRSLTAISKKNLIRTLNVSEQTFIDAQLMVGTSFLAQFPPLHDSTLIKHQPATISDAITVLRTSDKSVAACCSAFHDILQNHDPAWLDKYRRARMAVTHFIYVAETGEVLVNDFERLTRDNHEYLGLQLPSELFHYLNIGLVGPRILGPITHGQFIILPTLDGVATDEYKKLVTSQLVPIRETTLALLIDRLNRGIQYKNITMRVWYDRHYAYTSNFRSLQPTPASKAATFDVKPATIKEFFPDFASGSLISEVLALQSPEFASRTLAREKVKNLDTKEIVMSMTIWRFLYLRDYVNDKHGLTAWGTALATAMAALEPTVKKHPDVPHLHEALIMAFELVRFELLTARNRHEELHGLPMNGSEDDKDSVLLISRCATLLKLRHEANGYTGPLSKNLLTFHSLVSEIRSADRDLVEAILASMFMYAQAKRDRDDAWELSHRLPFLDDPDVAMGIAVKTFLDDSYSDTPETRPARLAEFVPKFIPYATAFDEDLEIAYEFFNAVHAGVKTLNTKDISGVDKAAWDKAAQFLAARR